MRGGSCFFLWKIKDYFYGHFESCLSTNGAWGQKLWKIFNSFGAANEPAHKEKNTKSRTSSKVTCPYHLPIDPSWPIRPFCQPERNDKLRELPYFIQDLRIKVHYPVIVQSYFFPRYDKSIISEWSRRLLWLISMCGFNFLARAHTVLKSSLSISLL